MARPITWQDVAAPNQAGNLAAFQNASNQLERSIGGLGAIAGDVRATQQQEATKAAVADIMASADPAAAAAAAPRGWEVDPLAVAQAAQARTGVLRQEKVQDAQLESARRQGLAADAAVAASEAATANNKYQLEQAQLSDKAAAIAQPFINEMRKSGKDVRPTFSADAEGLKAQALYEDALERNMDNLRLDEQMRWQREREVKDRNLSNALDELTRKGLSPEGLRMDAASQSRLIVDVFKRFNVGAQHIAAGEAAFKEGFIRGGARPEELSGIYDEEKIPVFDPVTKKITHSQGKRSFSDFDTALKMEAESIQRQGAENFGKFTDLRDVAELSSKSAFKDMTAGAMVSAAAKASGFDEKEISKAFEAQLNAAAEEKRSLPEHQAMEVALAELQRSRGWFRFGDADKSRNMREALDKYNKKGGDPEFVRIQQAAADQVTKQLAKVAEARAQLNASARDGHALPKAVLDAYNDQIAKPRREAAINQKVNADRILGEAARQAEVRRIIGEGLANTGVAGY